jgi:hypothetical protein
VGTKVQMKEILIDVRTVRGNVCTNRKYYIIVNSAFHRCYHPKISCVVLKIRVSCGSSCLINLVNIGQRPGINQDSAGLTCCKLKNVLEDSYDATMCEIYRNFQKGNALSTSIGSSPRALSEHFRYRGSLCP